MDIYLKDLIDGENSCRDSKWYFGHLSNNVDTNTPDIFPITFNLDLLNLTFLKITLNIDTTGSDICFNYICDFPFCWYSYISFMPLV